MPRLIHVPAPIQAVDNVLLHSQSSYPQTNRFHLNRFGEYGRIETDHTQWVDLPLAAYDSPSPMLSASSSTHDPLKSMLLWHLPLHFPTTVVLHLEVERRTHIVTATMLRAKFWDTGEIERWVEENASGDVLVQPTGHTVDTDWKFVFTGDETDVKHFADWITTVRKRYQIALEFVDGEQAAEFRQWVAENLSRRSSIFEGFRAPSSSTLMVRRETEATLVLMSWADRLPVCKVD